MPNSRSHTQIEGLLGAHSKLIMDPVHGGIPVLAHEVQVIDHPLFQRLRFICQNDILSMVFPGATHSRFLHSIGAMHVGGRMFESMIANLLHEYAVTEHAQIDQNLLGSIDYFRKVVRLACLLHDSGHCSFSHQFSRSKIVRHMMNETGRFGALWTGIDHTPFYRNAPDQLEHEHYSARVAYQVLIDARVEEWGIQMEDVLWLMETTDVACSEVFSQHANEFWRLVKASSPTEQPAHFDTALVKLFGNIVSGELDADRADYMLRDGFHSSVTIGGFNLDHLLSNLTIGYCNQTGWIGIAILRKGLGSLEDFVYSRYQMYRQVYAHKTAQGFDWLLQQAIDEVLSESETLQQVTTALSDIESFVELTDDFFWQAFKRLARVQKSYAGQVVNRVKLHHIATREEQFTHDTKALKTLLANEFTISESAIIEAKFKAKFSNINTLFNDIKVLINDKVTQTTSLQLISENSEFFEKFTDNTLIHFYIDPLTNSA